MNKQFIQDVLYECGNSDYISKNTLILILESVSNNYIITKSKQSLSNEELLEKFLQAKTVEGLSRGSIKLYRFHIKHLLTFLDNKPICSITTEDVRNYISNKDVCDRTLENIRACINSMFIWLTVEEYIDKNPMLKIKHIKFQRKQVHSLSDIQLATIRDRCTDLRTKAIVECLYSTGCRVSELVNIKLSDIDFNAGTITIFGKGKKYRTVYLNASSLVAISNYLQNRKGNSEYLFITKIYPFRHISIDTAARDLLKIDSPTHLHAHKFRHTMATTAIKHGMPVQELQTLLGHTKLDVTMQYVDVDNSLVKFHHNQYIC